MIFLFVHINDIGDTPTCKIYLFQQWILLVPINRLSPIIYDQLTSDKIFAGAQLYLIAQNSKTIVKQVDFPISKSQVLQILYHVAS